MPLNLKQMPVTILYLYGTSLQLVWAFPSLNGAIIQCWLSVGRHTNSLSTGLLRIVAAGLVLDFFMYVTGFYNKIWQISWFRMEFVHVTEKFVQSFPAERTTLNNVRFQTYSAW
jgi:hypothetical protein